MIVLHILMKVYLHSCLDNAASDHREKSQTESYYPFILFNSVLVVFVKITYQL